MKTCPSCNTANPDNQDDCLNCSCDLRTVPLDGQLPRPVESQGKASGFGVGDLKMVVTRGKYPGAAFLIDEPSMVIGRHDSETGYWPDIDLFDQEEEGKWRISRTHARVFVREGRLFVCDVGSVNGTYLNTPNRLSPHAETETRPGDVLALGTAVVMKVEED
jgi:pSer/pThr/pTyr-binding forkhead associated (FHA) protein